MKKLFFISIILFLMSCEKEKGDSYSKDLLGSWNGFKQTNSYSIVANTSLTVTNPYVSGNGSLIIDGAENAALNYIYMYSTNGVIMVSVSKNVFGISNEDENFLLNVYDYGDFGNFSQLFKTSPGNSDIYEGELEFDIHNSTITINSGALHHETVSDSVMITGSVAVSQTNVTAGNQTELGSLEWVFIDYTVNLMLNNDMTFTQTITNLDGDTEEFTGEWEGDSDEITLHFSGHSLTYEYSVSSSGLELVYIDDICMLTPDECLPQYELMYGMESGALEQVVLLETVYYTK